MRPWIGLVVIAFAQLMVALDATVVSVALPTMQRALGGSLADRQWIVTAYTLVFAGCLLVGGRLADTIGRRRAFEIGLIGFALASALGGAAQAPWMLIAARALQGAFAALLSPTALSLIAVTFTEPRERARAFAVFGGVAGSGAALGLVLGGWLTEAASWRWCLYVNVGFAAAVLVGARLVLPRLPPMLRRAIDAPSVGLALGGPVAIVAGCASALGRGWGSPLVIAELTGGLAMLALFAVRQRSAAAPLLPLHIVVDRNRGGAALTAGLAVVGMFGVFLLLTYDFQVVRGYSPLHAGLAFLPISAAGLFGSTIVAGRALLVVPPRAVITGGLAIAAAGLGWLARSDVDASYLTGILPAEIALGFGISCAMIAAFGVATHGVAPHEAGIASALVVCAQQIGGSLGTALLNTIAAAASAAFAAAQPSASAARVLVHGHARAAAVACAVLVAAAIAGGSLVTADRPRRA
jgi:EmrB/QacA subfamily drug resistance transporter